MKRYYVEVPITGKIMVELQAENDEEALKKVIDCPYVEELNKRDDVNYADFMWEVAEVLVEGNVFYGELDRAYVKELEDEE